MVYIHRIFSKIWQRVLTSLAETMGILDFFKSDGLRSANGIRHNGKRLSEILEQHAKFVRGDETGARAELSGADLSRVNFYKVNLTYANFQGANLEGASLREAKLASADLSKAKLRRADLRKA